MNRMFCALLLCCCSAALASPAKSAGKVVLASGFGWNAEDATGCLQAALDSGAAKVLVDRQPGDWIVRPLKVSAHGMEIVFCDGVTVRAKKGGFKGGNDCLFKIDGKSSDIVMRGEGNARLLMNKADYQDQSRYASAEWRHTLSIHGRRITVKDLSLLSSGGDGVYVNGASDVLLENLDCSDHHRQGISVIAAKNLTVRKCRFTGTRGTPPACGTDLEPNHSRNFFENVSFEDCDFSGNASGGILLFLGSLDSSSAPVSIRFSRCTSHGNGSNGICIHGSSGGTSPRGEITFDGCRAYGNGGSALRFVNVMNGSDRLKVILRNCELDALGTAEAGISFGGNIPFSIGNVTFENTALSVTDKGRGLDFSALPGTGLKDVNGTLTVDRSGRRESVDMAKWAAQFREDPEMMRFTTVPVDYRALKPATDAKRLSRPVRTGNLRGRFTFVQYHGEAGEYPIRFMCKPVGRNSNLVTVQVRDAAGTDLGRFSFTDLDYTYVAKVNGKNVTRLEVSTNSRVDIESEWPGMGIEAAGGVHLFAPGGRRFHFFVPAQATEVCVMLKPEEPMSAELLDAGGAVVQSKGFSAKPDILRWRKTSSKPETWSLAVPRVAEDAVFRIGSPAIPIVSPSREAMLVQ